MGRSLRCRLGLHSWRKVHDRERDVILRECRVCGKRLGTGFPPNVGGGSG